MEGGIEVKIRESVERVSFAMLKCVNSPVTISVYLSKALSQCLLLGFWGVGGVMMVGSVLVTRIRFGLSIGILGVLVGV